MVPIFMCECLLNSGFWGCRILALKGVTCVHGLSEFDEMLNRHVFVWNWGTLKLRKKTYENLIPFLSDMPKCLEVFDHVDNNPWYPPKNPWKSIENPHVSSPRPPLDIKVEVDNISEDRQLFFSKERPLPKRLFDHVWPFFWCLLGLITWLV